MPKDTYILVIFTTSAPGKTWVEQWCIFGFYFGMQWGIGIAIRFMEQPDSCDRVWCKRDQAETKPKRRINLTSSVNHPQPTRPWERECRRITPSDRRLEVYIETTAKVAYREKVRRWDSYLFSLTHTLTGSYSWVSSAKWKIIRYGCSDKRWPSQPHQEPPAWCRLHKHDWRNLMMRTSLCCWPFSCQTKTKT